MDITLPDTLRPDIFLFSETPGRFVVTIAPDHKRAFEQALGAEAQLLGTTGGNRLRVTGRILIFEQEIAALEAAYKAPFRGF